MFDVRCYGRDAVIVRMEVEVEIEMMCVYVSQKTSSIATHCGPGWLLRIPPGTGELKSAMSTHRPFDELAL